MIVLCAFLAIFILALVVVLVKNRHLSEELEVANRNLESCRVFFYNFRPAELVKRNLSEQAKELKEICDRQISMMERGWTPPTDIDKTNEVAVKRSFDEAHAYLSGIIESRKGRFWNTRLTAIGAAMAAHINLDEFGVDMNQPSWKDYLPDGKMMNQGFGTGIG